MNVYLTAEEAHALTELLRFVLRKADATDPDSSHLRRVQSKLRRPDEVLCDECSRPHYALGKCRRHYMAAYRSKVS